MSSSCTLKVEPHIRGHIASCNGRVDRIGAKAEQCVDLLPNATQAAALVEEQAKKERQKRMREMENFKKRVKQRATEWERNKQMQMAATTTDTIASEQRIAEQAVKLDKIKVQQSFEVAHDIEDIQTVASGKDSAVPLTLPGAPSFSQLARNKLLALKGSGSQLNSGPEKKSSVYFEPTVQYETVAEIQHDSRDSPKHKATIEPKKKSVSVNRFVNPGQIEHIRKKQAALQYLLFRRLYSDLEREQARQKQRQLTQAQQMEALKKDKEATRQLLEDEMNAYDSFSTTSSEATEDRERVREWAELLLLEERKQRLQKSKESQRFAEALRARQKEKLRVKESAVLPLCSCSSTILDADPFTCANNCPFYRNPKALEKALTAQLHSLEL